VDVLTADAVPRQGVDLMIGVLVDVEPRSS
jgi:hypothetical protein